MLILTSGIFDVKQIQVEGNIYLSKDKIISESGINYGQNILKIVPKDSEQKLKENPWIQYVKISRKFPNEILIQIVEKEKAAVIQYMGSFLIIDGTGCVLRIDDNLEGLTIPVVTGLDLKKIPEIGQAIDTNDKLQKKKLFEFLDAIKINDLKQQISELNLKYIQDIKLYTVGGLEIKLGQGDKIVEKLGLVRPILEDIWENQRTNGFIDMRFDGDPVFRKK